VKKEVTKVLKDMNFKVSIDSSSKLESATNLQPKFPVAIKKHIEPNGIDMKKLDIMGKYSLLKSLVVSF